MVFHVWHLRNSLILRTDSTLLVRFAAVVYIFPEKFCHHRDNSNFKLISHQCTRILEKLENEL